MALAKVRHKRGEEHLEVEGFGRVLLTDAGLVGNRETLEPAGLTSLRAALQSYEYSWGGSEIDIHVTDEPEGQIDDDSQVDQTSLIFKDGRLLAQTFLAVADQEPDEAVMRSFALPVLDRVGVSLVDIYLSEEKWGWGVWLTLEVPIARRSVGDALRLADLVSAAVLGAYPGEFDAESAAGVIRARHPELLVGLFENDWFDAKRVPYRLAEKVDQYEMAKDVSTFANANGGLILLGAKTKGRPTGDEVKSINGCQLTDVRADQMRALIKKRIYPRVEGVSVEPIPIWSGDRGVILIAIPPQPESQKPFLAVGTRSGDQISELGFTYAVREGEGAVAPRIEVVHQLIRAGRAVLAGDGSLGEIDALRADIEKLQAENLEGWVSDIVLAAAKNGFHVRQDGDRLTFEKGDAGPITAQVTTPGPPADLLHRQQLLERLADCGLPVRTNVKGFLEPLHDEI